MFCAFLTTSANPFPQNDDISSLTDTTDSLDDEVPVYSTAINEDDSDLNGSSRTTELNFLVRYLMIYDR